MDEAESDFIERFGLMSEQDGMPRIAGRVYALLLVREEALTLDDMANELQVSKASASTNARLLKRMGVVRRIAKPGDRRDFYEFSPDAIEISFEHIQQRMKETFSLLEATIPRLSEEREVARSRLEMMRDWHEFLLDDMGGLLARWKQQREQQSEVVDEGKDSA